MNETPLHKPLIAEEGKEKERVFTGTPERIVNICLASISALIIYWTVYVSADVMWKHGLYIMTVFCMTLVIYPFEKKPKVNHVSLVDWLLIIGSIAGSAYAIWEYLDRFMRLGMLTEMDIFFGCLMLFLGLEVGRRVIGWSLTLVSIVLILYSLYGFVIPGHFGHGGKALALAQQRDVFQRAAAPLCIQPRKQTAGIPAGERARDIIHVQHAAERQKLLRIWKRGVIFPL